MSGINYGPDYGANIEIELILDNYLQFSEF